MNKLQQDFLVIAIQFMKRSIELKVEKNELLKDLLKKGGK